MTFQEATIFKKQLCKDLITNHNLTMRVFVTPANHDDFTKYITDFRGGYFTDETSKKYSLNGQFKVHGIWTNSADVVYKDLTK